MKRSIAQIALAAAAVWLALWTATVLADPAVFNAEWGTVDGGGSRLNGGTFRLGGSIGQPDNERLSSNQLYVLWGGFWSGRTSSIPSAVELGSNAQAGSADRLQPVVVLSATLLALGGSALALLWRRDRRT